ncbi:MAG: amidohydrolase family protein [Promethearchaeota archaeon]
MNDNGATFAKTFYKFDIDIFKYLFEKTKQTGLQLTLDPGAILFQSIPVINGLQLGINCFEHCNNILASVLLDEQEKEHNELMHPDASQEQRMAFMQKILEQGTDVVDQSKLNKLISVMSEKQIYYCLTLGLANPELSNFVYTGSLPELTEEEKKNYSKINKEIASVFEVSEEEQKQMANYLSSLEPFTKLFTKELAKSNVKVMNGYDFFYPILAIKELEVMQEYGLSPAQILNGATLYPTEWLGITKDYGALKEERKANIVVVNENPLEDIKNIKRVHLVLKDGLVVSRGTR